MGSCLLVRCLVFVLAVFNITGSFWTHENIAQEIVEKCAEKLGNTHFIKSNRGDGRSMK